MTKPPKATLVTCGNKIHISRRNLTLCGRDATGWLTETMWMWIDWPDDRCKLCVRAWEGEKDRKREQGESDG